LTTQKIETRMDRGISLFRERSQEIREVEPGIYRAPSTTGRRGSGHEQAGVHKKHGRRIKDKFLGEPPRRKGRSE
jgi:hypothetical protein